MRNYIALLIADWYKNCHANQANSDMDYAYAYYICRMSRLPDVDKVTLFGLQAFIDEYLIGHFNRTFFSRDIEEVVSEYMAIVKPCLATDGLGEDNIRGLHELGYLPISIRAVPEGARVNIGVPQIEIANTVPGFAWVVGLVETMMSSTLWHAQVSAEVGYRYRKIVDKYADLTCDDNIPRARMLGDFSMRGQESIESATKSSAAFLLSFLNTATIPAILWLAEHYDCDITKDPIGYGACSTEHSIMCSNTAIDSVGLPDGVLDEETYVKKLLIEIYPDTAFSMVSDSYDYWNMVEVIIPKFKDIILARNKYIGIRGDSGDPVEIVTKTVVSLLDSFGYTINSKGCKVLPSQIRVIYGDSITPQRLIDIAEFCVENKIALNNIILGVGSFSFQCLEELMSDGAVKYHPYTRDTFGVATKVTYGRMKDGTDIFIEKKPKTDSGNFKTSPKGCCNVTYDGEDYRYQDGLTMGQVCQYGTHKDAIICAFREIFADGKFVTRWTLDDVRKELHAGGFY